MTERFSLSLGPDVLDYELRRSDRRTLGITVRPDGGVVVTAPRDAELTAVQDRLRRRAGWLLATQRDFTRLRPRTPERRYVSGETHRFLGRQYRLIVDPAARRGVTQTHEHLTIGGPSAEAPGRVRNCLNAWYRRHAREIFSKRLDAGVRAINAQMPRLVVRPMDKRWGSLSAGGRSLILNCRLIEADLDGIDFVIAHELCHLIHRDHGPAFQDLLSARMPDWRARKTALECWMM